MIRLIFAALFLFGSLFEMIYNASKGWSLVGNTPLLSAASGETFLWLDAIFALIASVFLVLASISSRLSWSAAVGSLLMALMGLLNLISVIAGGIFDGFRYAGTEGQIYYALFMLANLVQLICWLLIGLHYLLNGRVISSSTKTALVIITMVFSLGEILFFILNTLANGGGRYMQTSVIVMWFLISTVCVRACQHLAVMTYNPN
jgi:hypothetical protein